MSPYEKLYNEKPNTSHFQTFGCLCFVSTPQQARSKFNARAHASIFIGYVHSQKAYKTYNPTTNKIIISRDVHFQEHHFPYHFHTPPHSPFSQFYLPASTPLPPYDDAVTFPSHTTSLLPPFIPLHHPSSSSNITSDTNISSSSSLSPHTPTSISNPSLVVDLSQPSVHQSITPLPLIPRKSTRPSKPPDHLNDFVCSNAHWCNVVHFDSLSSAQ